MIDVGLLLARVTNLDAQDLDCWVAKAWVRPERGDQGYLFQEIDVARVVLIRDLIVDMRIDEESVPLVLSLLDQLYDARRRMREIGAALAEVASEELRLALIKRLAERDSDPLDHIEPRNA